MEGEDRETTWKREFGKWNEENLETYGVVHISSEPNVLLVVNNHPAMSLLRNNANLIAYPSNLLPKPDGQFYRMSTQVFTACCSTIRDNVFPKNKAQTRPDVSESETVSELHYNAV